MRFTVILCLAGVVSLRPTMRGARDRAHGEHHLPADYESIASCCGSLPLHSLATFATWQGVQIRPLDPARGHELAQWVLDELGTPALVPLEGS